MLKEYETWPGCARCEDGRPHTREQGRSCTTIAPTMNYALRPSVREDSEFLFRLYGTTRPEISALGWSAEQQEAFLHMQFNAQQNWYGTTYPDADHQIIEVEGKAVGRIMIASSPETNLLVDISLLPEFRHAGIGTALIEALIEKSRMEGRRVRLQVLKTNPAQELYRRLGFVQTAEEQMYVHMEKASTG